MENDVTCIALLILGTENIKSIELINMVNPIFLFVFNIVKLIYVVNYHCCRYFHRNPIPAPTSWISF